jgi:hydrogenase maturation protein HypF
VIGSQHVGDLGDIETDRAWERTIADLLAMYRIDPAELLVVHDAHPGYVTTRGAQRLACGKRLAVQHHRAHVASVLAERGELDRRVVGLALDGTGHGDDGTTWGFELFVGSVRGGFERVAHPRPAVLPGGDAAARHPVQAAAGFLATIDTPDLHAPPFEFPGRYDQALQLVRRQVRCFPTTSAGRLFDTAAALCGFTREITYEGQAAIWLEAQARQAGTSDAYPFPDLDFRPLLAGVIADRLAGRPVPEIARAFHAGLAAGLAAAASRLARAAGLRDVACSGGVFQNRLLCRLLEECLETGLTVLHNEVVPPGDGGIALGQAALGAVAGVDPGLGS